ncbi:NAD(P)/FAD-dependent oxidoreductase [Streptomyces sp. NPDC085929]|uniref:NAD(P)/FAD-dependent oxidoreductase n=1 Tax=Streptomyces sp. NPDC085929 TaxID=3365739 RepID=UPI0037D4CFC8
MGSALVVVGAGVIGCAVAAAASDLFDKVVLLDARPDTGLAASWAAIGGITPQSDDFCRGPLRQFAEASRRMYPQWLAGLEAGSGIAVPFLDSGLLQVALDPSEQQRVKEQLVPQWVEQGFRVEQLDARTTAHAEPLLSPAVLSAVRLPGEGALEPRVLMSALREVLRRNPRIEVVARARVQAVTPGAGGVEVLLEGGGVVRGDRCVVAAGAWSSELVPTRPGGQFPVRGQAAELVVPGGGGYPLRHHVYCKVALDDTTVSSYVVPRHDGRVVVGVTYDQGRWDEEPEDHATERLLAALRLVVPASRDWRLTGSWAGIRPGTADGYPLVGNADADGRVVMATGHFGVGITLAPITAALVRSILSGAALTAGQAEALRVMDPRRFL